MPHMQPQIHERANWIPAGPEFDWLPEGDIPPNAETWNDELRENCYAVRWSAPGYTDCTNWHVCDSLAECIAVLFGDVGPSATKRLQAVRSLGDSLLADSAYTVEPATAEIHSGDARDCWVVLDTRNDVAREVYLTDSNAYVEAVYLAENIPEEHGGIS